MVLILSAMLCVFAAYAYPISYTSCGVDRTVSQSPQRIVTMNQGATEFVLALGLADRTVGTAYLDDYIWPQYATAYASIPVLSSSYPTEAQIAAKNPDFIVASYNSAFRQVYDGTKGIFNTTGSNALGLSQCVGTGSEWAGAKATCRPQLHAQGISTYLFKDACEDKSLRPRTVTEQTVYEEMRTMGRIFSVDAEALITEMKADFTAAAAMVSSSTAPSMKAVWLDCVGRCCKTDPGVEPQVFVGAGAGAPGMLMTESGLTNVFANVDENWACVNVSQVVAAAPDVIIVVDAAWDTALSKLTWLYNNTDFCNLDALQGARLVQIPFSATTLSPRNGPAALDLAKASLHVRIGSVTPVQKSGVSSFNPPSFRQHISGLQCTLNSGKVMYDILTDGATTGTAATTGSSGSSETSSAIPNQKQVLWLCILAWLAACY